MGNKVDLVYESFGRCSIKSSFFDDFYDSFLGSHPDIPPMFAETDMKKQKKLLRNGISFMILYAKDHVAGVTALKRIGEVHDRNNANISPDLYKFWVDSLLGVVQKYDTKLDAEIEAAWRDVMQKGVDYFISVY